MRVSAISDKEASSGLGLAGAVRRRAERCSAALVASANLNSRIRRFSLATADQGVGSRSASPQKLLQAGHLRGCKTTTSHVHCGPVAEGSTSDARANESPLELVESRSRGVTVESGLSTNLRTLTSKEGLGLARIGH